jgi:hypothetical protein
VPVQPSRILLQLVKEMSSRLNALGIELLEREFVNQTLKTCRETVAGVYDEFISSREVSEDTALQLLADVVFLWIALSGESEFATIRDKLVKKVRSVQFAYCSVEWTGLWRD